MLAQQSFLKDLFSSISLAFLQPSFRQCARCTYRAGLCVSPGWYPAMHPCQGCSKEHRLVLHGFPFPAWTLPGRCKGFFHVLANCLLLVLLMPSIILPEKICCTAAAFSLSFQIVSMRFSMVDLSCYSLEEVPEHLFYCQDITYLNLRHNFMRTSGAGGLDSLYRSAKNHFSSTFVVLDMWIQK